MSTTTPINAFIGRTSAPTDNEVAGALGESKAVWDKLLADLAEEHGLTEREWNTYSPKVGWSLRLIHKKRRILYLVPCEDCFRVTLVLGGKAMKAAYESDLPERAVKLLKESKKYPEGNAIYIDVKSVRDLPFIKKLASIKMAN